MKKLIKHLLLVVGLLPALTGCVTPTPVVVREAPPPPAVDVVVAPPGPRYVWVPGYWSWQGRWVWVPGRWQIAPYPTAVWVPGHWAQRGEGYVWVAGHWR